MNDRLNDILKSAIQDNRVRWGLVAVGTTLTILSTWAIHDQHRWRSLDTGGTPPTWAGYWRMTQFRVQRFFTGGSLRHHWLLSPEGTQYLSDSIPPRQGPRPESREWTLPQRQQTEPIDPAVHARIHSWTEKYVNANKDMLDHKLSKTEGLSAMAAYAKPGLSTRNPEAQSGLIGDEIFHSHPEDSSLHVWLSEADLKKVVAKGWGERFPLSALGKLHRGFAFIYAPRTMEECDVVEEIIKAGIEFVAGQKPV